MLTISFVISGPFASRFTRLKNIDDLIQSLHLLRRINPENEIILSTYLGEVPQNFARYFNKIIYNADPGADAFKNSPWPIGKNVTDSANISRMLSSTIAGIEACSHAVVLKTRIELFPVVESDFLNWLSEVEVSLRDTAKPMIGFFTEHYTGISFAINGILGVLPDTLQIANRTTLLDTWKKTEIFWKEHHNLLARKEIRFSITSEQLFGMNYLANYCGFPIDLELRKLRRQYISLKLIRSILYAEKNLYIWTQYKKSGFSVNYLRGTYGIKVPDKVHKPGSLNILIALFIVLLKKIKHHYRRYLVAYIDLLKYKINFSRHKS